MVSINYSAREVCCKIVYYGPGLSGKTTNLQYVHSKVPQDTRGKLISLATEADRTLYFDFLPLNIGSINGFTAKFQLYTVPGQVYYNATRKLVLRGVDGVVFVADSQPDKMDDNLESLLNLEENLQEYGYDVNTLPIVIQYNKRDIPGVLSVDELNQALNKHGWPTYEASATIGNGVFDTLKLIIKLVLDKAKRSSAPKMKPTVTAQPAPAVEVNRQPEEPSYPAPPPVQPQQPAEQERAAEPAYSAEPKQPAAFDQPPAQPAEPVPPAAAAPQPQEQFRPYPGSGAERPAEGPSGAATATVEAPQSGSRPESPESTAVQDNAPRMAPPVKQKPAKKRGFFKRLFGIK